ncbi:MAG: hypothetical protein E6G34_01170 [Actinobacteria bacterium]|nr:MAG: hypothetical protein E6G34_01170 [Actinomycetota bacterium]
MLKPLCLVLFACVALQLAGVPHPTSTGIARAQARARPAGAAEPRSVVIALLPTGERALARVPGFSIGLMSAAQGTYSRAQLLLDTTQGARVASSAYARSRPAALSLAPAGEGGVIAGWSAAVRRAHGAPALLRPGLLAARIPGGAAYAGIAGTDALDAVLASDEAGRVHAVSMGPAGTVVARAAALAERSRLVVCDLAAGAAGRGQLRALQLRRGAGQLLLVIQRAGGSAHQLLWAAAAGLEAGPAKDLTSATTAQRGLISAVDVATTVLAHLHIMAPSDALRGKVIHGDGALDSPGLRTLMGRLAVIGPRRLRALACLLGAWAALLLLAAAGRAREHKRRVLRVGALAMLWTPAVGLVAAAIEPSPGGEYAIFVCGCLALGALSDAALPWPRAPLIPALMTLAALVVDALARSQLQMRSLLGPNPILGARFYGFGNELKPGLAVLVLCAVAASLYPARRGSRAVLTMAGAGVALAAVVGSAKIGAGVGGVILISGGFAVASVLLLPGSMTRARALAVLASPVLALIALAGLDLATANGSGHYTGSILHAHSTGEVRDVIVRRYSAAWRELRNHAMPVATALALSSSVHALRRRDRLLAPVAVDPAWLAAFAGGLVAGLLGSLSEDSGPVLLVVAVFTLGCLAAYLWGRPRTTPRSRGRHRVGRSRALPRSAGSPC